MRVRNGEDEDVCGLRFCAEHIVKDGLNQQDAQSRHGADDEIDDNFNRA